MAHICDHDNWYPEASNFPLILSDPGSVFLSVYQQFQPEYFLAQISHIHWDSHHAETQPTCVGGDSITGEGTDLPSQTRSQRTEGGAQWQNSPQSFCWTSHSTRRWRWHSLGKTGGKRRPRDAYETTQKALSLQGPHGPLLSSLHAFWLSVFSLVLFKPNSIRLQLPGQTHH